MQYEIIGGNLPAVLCRLTRGEKIICEMETKQEIAWAIKETALREALKRQ